MTAFRIIVMMFCLPFMGFGQYFGESDHVMNKTTTNADIMDFWKADQATKSTYMAAYEVLSAHPQAMYQDVVKNEKFKSLAAENGWKLFSGPMLGDLQSDGVTIWLRSIQPTAVKIRVKGSGLDKTFGPVYTDFDTDLRGQIKITGLRPDRQYEYQVLLDDEVLSLPMTTRFKTSPVADEAEETRIVFGSCPHRWGLWNEKMMEFVQSRDPDALMLLGDIAVQDRMNNIGMHKADYLLRDQSPAWQDVVSQIPVYASWDDHDYFGNDLAGVPEGYVKKDKEAVAKVFRESWNNPAYAEDEETEGIYFRTRIGMADVIMTDNRYYRSGGEASFLGREQMDWLKAELLKCRGPFIVLSCGSMWSDYVSNGKDSWGVNDAEGREELFSFIEENNIKGVVLISGDRHGARGFTIPRSNGFQFYEFEAASMGARVGPPAQKEEWTTQLYGIDGQFAFGELTMKANKEEPSLHYRLLREDGRVLYQKSLKLSDLTPQ
ncbi:alkaline phosphatase D family protein [Membranihabitans marinus]|uniref:alkaline phosphatase D family protein n=1 Tax=Membranihabitans marinus TaxID=1227546 RepID=UPI001F2717F6|nr:alkaline phosphatase D family protein [Membranihabitans marinus]